VTRAAQRGERCCENTPSAPHAERLNNISLAFVVTRAQNQCPLGHARRVEPEQFERAAVGERVVVQYGRDESVQWDFGPLNRALLDRVNKP